MDGGGKEYLISNAFRVTNNEHISISFVEWEKNPERKKVAAELLKTKEFTPIPGKSFHSCQL